MDVREAVSAVVEGIREGRILQTIERWYDEDVQVTETGEPPRQGKAVHRAHERAFVNRVEFHGAEATSILIDGDRAVVEWVFDVTPRGGERVQKRRLALQEWRDGRIVRENVFHG